MIQLIYGGGKGSLVGYPQSAEGKWLHVLYSGDPIWEKNQNKLDVRVEMQTHFTVWLNYFLFPIKAWQQHTRNVSSCVYSMSLITLWRGENICTEETLPIRILTCSSFAHVSPQEIRLSIFLPCLKHKLAQVAIATQLRREKHATYIESQTSKIQGKRHRSSRLTDWSLGCAEQNCSNERLAPNMKTK